MGKNREVAKTLVAPKTAPRHLAGRTTRARKITKGSMVQESLLLSHIQDIKRGYPVKRFDSLKESLGLTSEELARITNMSLATIHRRRVGGHFLTPDESEKIYRLEKLYFTAKEVMGNDEDSARSWFNTPQIVFGGKKPIEYADTLPGCEEIERVLRRMEQGIVL